MSDNGSNDWNVAYSSIEFFARMLSSHTAVESYDRVNDIQFDIRRKSGLRNVNAVLIDVYVFGEGAFYGVLEDFEGVTAIVNNGHWNSIAFDWREIASRTGVATFAMNDFMGALNFDDFKTYTLREEREKRREQRRRRT